MKSIPINLSLAPKIEFEEISNLNDKNIIFLLGQIEEYLSYINKFLTKNLENEEILRSLSLYAPNAKPKDAKLAALKDILELKDTYKDPDLEESNAPISISELRNRAKKIVSVMTESPLQRRSVIT